MDTLNLMPAGTKPHVLLILGSSGNIGQALLYQLSDLLTKYEHVYCVDITSKQTMANYESTNISFLTADAVQDEYFNQLAISSTVFKLDALNLIAQDFPVNSKGLSIKHTSPFQLSTSDYILSLGATAGSSYNLIRQIQMNKFFDSSIWLIGSIYNHILPDTFLYSDDSSLYKPIAYSSGKYAQLPLRDQAARYFAHTGGRCNSLSFGGIQSSQDEEFIKKYSTLCPSGRLVYMSEVTSTIMWALLKSPDSMNGADILIDGAFHLK